MTTSLKPLKLDFLLILPEEAEHPWLILKGKKTFTIFSEWKLILSENRWNKNKETTQKIVTHNPLRLDYVSKEQKRVAIYIFWKRP